MTTPDPTTRDPAASLRACIELAAKAREWQCTGDRIRCEDGHGCECAMADKECPDWVDACLHFITSDAAPALLAEVGKEKERAAYWKQRAKAAEGHLWASDHEAAARALHSVSTLTVTPWDELTDSQRFGCYRAVSAVLRAVNDRRDERRPHHGARTGEGK